VALGEGGPAQRKRDGDPQPVPPASVLADGDNRSEHAEFPSVRRRFSEGRRRVPCMKSQSAPCASEKRMSVSGAPTMMTFFRREFPATHES
jgi:hypothetical protein